MEVAPDAPIDGPGGGIAREDCRAIADLQLVDERRHAAVQVAEEHIPFFKTGKLLRERMNDNIKGPLA